MQEQVKLGRLLGAGAAACVYAGVWRGQPVAVKLAHPSSADPKSFARCAPGLWMAFGAWRQGGKDCAWYGHGASSALTSPRSGAREVEMMAAVGRHPHIIGVLAACLEQPLAVVQVSKGL